MHCQNELKDKCIKYLLENFNDFLGDMPNSDKLPNDLMKEIVRKNQEKHEAALREAQAGKRSGRKRKRNTEDSGVIYLS